MADVFHPLRMAMVTMAGYGVVAAWGGVFAQTSETFLAAWVMHGVLSGCYLTSAASLGQRLFPHDRYAQFASASGILMGLGSMILAPLVGSLIDITGNQYRNAFLVGSILAFASLFLAWRVYRRFLKLGGTSHYAAPSC